MTFSPPNGGTWAGYKWVFSDNGQTPYSPYSHSIHYIAGDPEGGFPAARDPPKSRSWSTTDYVSDL